MKKNRTIIILLTVTAIVLAIGYGYREYTRKPALLDSVSPDVMITADALLEQYKANEDSANAKYLGKVVEVSGIISSISNEQDTLVNILLGKKEALAHVSCSMSAQSLTDAKKLQIGAAAKLRGICTGYLMDVELNRCVIIK